MSEETDNGLKALEVTIAQLHKQYGVGSVMRLGSTNIKPWQSVSTGALTLDTALGIGGFPRGRVVEIFGPESSGKSTIALTVVAKAQQMGLTCAYIDAEHALDPVYMQAVGINLDDLLLAQPDYGEQGLDIADRLLRTGQIGLIVIDSVAALVPKAELDGEMEQAHMGLQARMMAKALRKMTGLAAQHNTLIIFINQLRNKIGVMFGNPETTPGGMSLKFYASVRIDIRKREDLKDKQGVPSGIGVKAKIVKNKMAPPMKVVEFNILYAHGIDEYGCLFDVAVSKNIFTQKGSWVYYNGENYAQGKDNAIEKLKEDQELIDLIKDSSVVTKGALDDDM